MTTIPPLLSQGTQRVAFKGNDEQKKHPGAAVASFLIPGTGQLIKGETGNGLTRMGIWAGIFATSLAVNSKMTKTVSKNIPEALKEYFKACYKGVSKSQIAANIVLSVAALTNGITAAVDAYKPKKQ